MGSVVLVLLGVGLAQCQWLTQCPTGCQTCYDDYGEIRCRTCTAGYAHYGVLDVCYKCGDRCTSCTYSKAAGISACSACEAGTYRDYNPPFRNCLACYRCDPGMYTQQVCDFYGNTACAGCLLGTIVVPRADGTSYCVGCELGATYSNSDYTACLPCSTCRAPGKYMVNGGQCQTWLDARCADCTDNKATSADNLGTCDTCKADFFKVPSGNSFVCQRCDSVPCGANYYIQCTNAQRQCMLCPGTTSGNTCAIGHEPSKACPGTDTIPSECRPCLKGTERPNTGSLTCTRCAQVGFFKAVDGAQNCGPCTNKPQSNSVYLTWGTSIPDNANCPW